MGFEAAEQIYIVDCATCYKNFPCRCVVHDGVSAHGIAIASTISCPYLATFSIGIIPIHR